MQDNLDAQLLSRLSEGSGWSPETGAFIAEMADIAAKRKEQQAAMDREQAAMDREQAWEDWKRRQDYSSGLGEDQVWKPEMDTVDAYVSMVNSGQISDISQIPADVRGQVVSRMAQTGATFTKETEAERARQASREQGNFALDILESTWDRVRTRGPLGNIFGWASPRALTPERDTYKNTREASVNQIARAILPERVTDMDAKFALGLIPALGDTQAIAQRKFNNLRLLLSGSESEEVKREVLMRVSQNPSLDAKDVIKEVKAEQGAPADKPQDLENSQKEQMRARLRGAGYSEVEINAYFKERGL